MGAGAVLLGFLNAALSCAVVVLVALVVVWVLRWVGVAVDGAVYKWGQIVVGLLCLIIVVSWLLSLLGGSAGLAPHFRW